MMNRKARCYLTLACCFAVGCFSGCTAMKIADVTPNLPKADISNCVSSDVDMLVSSVKAKPLSDVKKGLPPAMKEDPVVDAFLRLARNSFVAGAKAATPSKALLNTTEESPPGDIGQRELRQFARNVLKEEMKPTISNPRSGKTKLTDTFAVYFNAYYKGNYVDRFGAPITKPSVALTVSDQEIANALSVLVDYILDSIDPTPVWGSDPLGGVNDKTKFYPGAGSKPTFLAAYGVDAATYQTIQPGPCGITLAKTEILSKLASAAADEGATVSGLVHGSFGGFSVGLGFLGKFSFGDNQTLATIVKSAASRLSARLTLAGTWPILARIDYDPSLDIN
jgi:hypothetical protein